MTKFNHLFQPISIGNLELQNRIICLSIITRYGIDGHVTPRLVDFTAERAKGGSGLVVTGTFSISHTEKRPVFDSIFDGIYHDRFIPGIVELTKSAHANGSKIAAQIGVGYYWAPGDDAPSELVGPSEVYNRADRAMPREMTTAEVKRLAEQFGEAGRRAREGGFDAIEIGASVGTLVNRFISSCTNNRTDEYGGTLEKRMRLPLEIIDTIKKNAGEDFPIIWRMSAEELMEGGHTMKESQQVALILEKAGVDCLDIAVGWHESTIPLIQGCVPQGAFVHMAQGIKEVVTIPVVGAYRIKDPLMAERFLSEGKADIIGMARALIADPYLPQKAQANQLDDICPCVACCRCLDLVHAELVPLACSVNPRVGREAEYTIAESSKKRKVFVIGAGPGGMEAARVTALRGHQVTLFEKSGQLGGQLIPASAPADKRDMADLTEYLSNQMTRTGVEVRLGEEANFISIKAENPDSVIIATGAIPASLEISGADSSIVADPIDVLNGKVNVGKRVIVAGGGLIGCEVALFLADGHRDITITSRQKRVGYGIGPGNRWVVLQQFQSKGIKLMPLTTIEEITDKGMQGVREGESVFIEADTIVLAGGMKSEDALANELRDKLPEVHLIGDCIEPRTIETAMEEGFRTAMRI
ncbi:MAG: FAD-dependent oxidoreductase [Chloroflexota bacterium]|nr:FAD-dependent oxidoreductase [Chloroflexota bacterium]